MGLCNPTTAVEACGPRRLRDPSHPRRLPSGRRYTEPRTSYGSLGFRGDRHWCRPASFATAVRTGSTCAPVTDYMQGLQACPGRPSCRVSRDGAGPGLTRGGKHLRGSRYNVEGTSLPFSGSRHHHRPSTGFVRILLFFSFFGLESAPTG